MKSVKGTIAGAGLFALLLQSVSGYTAEDCGLVCLLQAPNKFEWKKAGILIQGLTAQNWVEKSGLVTNDTAALGAGIKVKICVEELLGQNEYRSTTPIEPLADYCIKKLKARIIQLNQEYEDED